MANRALAYYGRNEIDREEEYEAYRHLMHPGQYRRVKDHYYWFNEGIGQGAPMILSPYTDDLQFDSTDGHVQNNVTESGLQTRVNNPGGSWR